MRYPYYLSNEADVAKTLEYLENERKSFSPMQIEVRRLHKTDVTCTNFMLSNPNAQLAYAVTNGMFPQTGEIDDG